MPYLKHKDRIYFESLVKEINKHAFSNGGELNYIFTELTKQYLLTNGESYAAYNTIIGALECCKLELYRRKTAPYEDVKIETNTDVY